MNQFTDFVYTEHRVMSGLDGRLLHGSNGFSVGILHAYSRFKFPAGDKVKDPFLWLILRKMVSVTKKANE